MKKILYATDYSEPSQCALHIATSLARDWAAVLLIVHVSQTECCPVGDVFDEEPEPSPEEVQRLQTIVPDDADVPFKHHLICPPPSSENVHPADLIVRFAKQEKVDAIVIGTHGRTGLSRVLLGSVAESVMRQASCPVITVNPDCLRR
jgi:nucleotide-binding universal stress UspA family protein